MSCSFCGVHNITDSSIYLTRGGDVDMFRGAMRFAGSDGFYWSSIAHPSEIYMYYFNFTSTEILPSNNDYRLYGFTV